MPVETIPVTEEYLLQLVENQHIIISRLEAIGGFFAFVIVVGTIWLFYKLLRTII